jgi:TP901 family phage tail tape measure protein
MNESNKYLIQFIAETVGFKEAESLMDRLKNKSDQMATTLGSQATINASGKWIDPKSGKFLSQQQVVNIGAQTKQNLLNAGVEELNKLYKTGDITAGEYKKTLGILGEQFGLTSGQVSKLDLTHQSFLSTQTKLALRAIAVIPIWMALRTAIQGVTSAIGASIKFMVDFESAMAQIRIVGKGTEEEYRNLGSSLLTMSKMFGVSASEALNAAKLFAQQGLTVTETIAMTRNAMIASVILGEDMVKVSEDLTAATRAYNISMDDSITIVDKWQAVQKNFAVTSKDLADATKTAGAAASAIGISYDKYLGHVTAIIEVTRKTGSQAANALQMIYSRVLTTARESIQTIAQVPVYQNAAGQSVMETTNIFRSTSDVLDDVALSWNSLNESQKINLATQIGSRRQLTPFIALMDNYTQSIKAQISSLGAAGQAYHDFNIMQDTTAVKMKQTQSSWLGVVSAIGDTRLMKGTLDFLKGLGDAVLYLTNSTKYYISYHQEWLTNEVLKAQTIENETLALQKLSIMRDNYNKKLQTAPDTQKGSIKEIINEIDKAMGGKTFDPTKLLEDTKNRVRVQVRSELVVTSKELNDLELKLIKLKNIQSTPKPMNILAKTPKYENYVNKEVTADIQKTELAIQSYNKTIDEEVTKRLTMLDVEEKNKKLKEDDVEREKQDLEVLKEKELLVDHEAKIMELRNKTEEQILRWKIKQYEIGGILENSENARFEKSKLVLELEEKILAARMEYSNAVKDSLSTSISEVMSGTSNAGSIMSGIQDTMIEQYRKTASEGISNLVMGGTGIGDIFGGAMSKLKEAFGIVQQKVEQKLDISNIALGQIVENTAALAGVSGANASASISGTSGGIVAGTASSGGLLNLGIRKATDWWYGTNEASSTGTQRAGVGGIEGTGMGSAVDYAALAKAQQKSQNTAGIVSGGVEGIMTGYNAYQSAKAGGASTTGAIMSGVGGLGMTIGSIGVTQSWNVVGWVLLIVGALLTLSSLFMKSEASKQTSSETKSSEVKVSSKIDITNKQLEVVNRNLVALKNTITTYILPSSAYFAEKMGLDEQFAVNSRRGLV